MGQGIPDPVVERKQPLRIASIDEYRGYAIFGMILVNYLGYFDLPGVGYAGADGAYVDFSWLFRHTHGWFSYADTIAPIFIFVVGMGFRLSLPRRLAKEGRLWGTLGALRRYSILAFMGLCYGGFDWRVSIWDALLDIALAGMLALPFMDRGPRVRIAVAVLYLAFYQFCFSLLGYGPWTTANSIDGGPLGIFSWAFILLMGTLVMDWLRAGPQGRVVERCLAWGLVLVAVGWLLKWPWGDFKAHWPFSQKGMDAPYALYSTGIAFLNFVPFYLLADRLNVRLPHLTVLGSNPLVLYIVQGIICGTFHAYIDSDLPLFTAIVTYIAAYAICYAVASALYRRGWFVKV